MANVDLLRASCVVAREISQRSSFRLKFRKRIQRVVIVKIIVNGGFLIVVERMVDLDLKLIATVSLVGNGYNCVCASPRTGHILKQAQSYGIEATLGNLIAREDVAVRDGVTAARHASDKDLRGRGKPLVCGKRSATATTVLQHTGDGGIRERSGECRQVREIAADLRAGGHGNRLRDDSLHDSASFI